MIQGKIYMRPEDIQTLLGLSRSRAYALHLTIRTALTPDTGDQSVRDATAPHRKRRKRIKKHLTILEYCRYMDEDFYHIYFTLRGEAPEYPPQP